MRWIAKLLSQWVFLVFVGLFFSACGDPQGLGFMSDENSAGHAESENLLSPSLEVATLGGGCFWCTEAVFESLEGVEDVVSGYMGGTVQNPTYEAVKTGGTGHAEVIQLFFDPTRITYSELLEVFWQAHDPTTLNRQGPDEGPQYRSAIFFHSAPQKNEAELSKTRLDESGRYEAAAVTEISRASQFWPAEDYHQDFYRLNGPDDRYCRFVITPKLQKLGLD